MYILLASLGISHSIKRGLFTMSRKFLGVAVSIAVLMLAACAFAWNPSGWVYMNWPYAFDSDDGSWHYFDRGSGNYGDVSVVNLSTDSWYDLGLSSLSGVVNPGWAYFNYPYAYCSVNRCWYFFEQRSTQWTCNLSTGKWTELGSGSGSGSIPSGYWSASSSNNYSIWFRVNSSGNVYSAYLKVYFNDGWMGSLGYTFEPEDITIDGNAFTCNKEDGTFNSAGDSLYLYQFWGVLNGDGSVSGEWRCSYYQDPSWASPHFNERSGTFRATR